jgi:hypothetical protein
MKPHKGAIIGRRVDVEIPAGHENFFPQNLGYIVVGAWRDHPQFGRSLGQTSLIVKKGRWSKYDEFGYRTCKIETLNSQYIWEQRK